MAVYKPHAVKLFPDSLSAEVVLTDATQFEDMQDLEMRAEVTANNTSPSHVAAVARKPMHRGSTYDIKGLLDVIGVSGLTIAATVDPGLVVYYQKFDDTGPATGGSVNRSFTYTKGLIVPKSIKVDHQGDAKLDYEFYALGDGTNAHITIADNVALPTITAVPKRYTLGPITIGGVALSSYRSLEIDFGNSVEVDGHQSSVDAVYISQKTHTPKITITGVDPTWFLSSTVAIGGLVVANATDKIFLRKRAQTAGHFVANATAEHIKFTPAGLAGIGKAAGAEMQRISETTIQITLATDASGNAPLVLNSASAIS